MSMSLRRAPGRFLALLALALASPARAEDDDPRRAEIEAWLDSDPASADVSKAPEAPEAPPMPPRKHGFVVETSLGVLGHLGALKHVSPTQPWLRVAFGWEPTRWLMLLAQGDASFGSTEYAMPPPEPRGFALLGASGAVRFGLQPWDTVAFFAQGEIGAAGVTDDVLLTYGFTDSDGVSPYFGAMAGVEWYQVSPHLALHLHGGVRSYSQLLAQAAGSDSALSWTGGLGMKYTF
jgi:hypothetical protein